MSYFIFSELEFLKEMYLKEHSLYLQVQITIIFRKDFLFLFEDIRFDVDKTRIFIKICVSYISPINFNYIASGLVKLNREVITEI